MILGGGFGGFYAARELERLLPAQSARVTLVNETNFMLYTPLLPGVVGAALDPRHVVVPLRQQLPRTEVVIGSVTGADPADRQVDVTRIDEQQVSIQYDHLIVALGSISRTFPIPGLAEHAIGLKSLADATALRNRVLECLDIAEASDDERSRAEHLGFVFVGAGYAGVEGLAELQDFAAGAIENYPRSRLQGMNWVLVEAAERVMKEMPGSLSRFAEEELRGRGIEIRTSSQLARVSDSSVELASGEIIPTRTVVWTAGVRPSPAIAKLPLSTDPAGRITVDRDLRAADPARHFDGRIWAIGDCAAVPDPSHEGHVCPPTAQHAIRQGRLVAKNIAAALVGRPTAPFTYKTKGVVAELGRSRAVAITLGVGWRGFPAWLITRTYHLMLMPGVGRRLRLLIDWNVALLFGRDSASPGRLGRPVPLQEPPTSHAADSAAGAEERELPAD